MRDTILTAAIQTLIDRGLNDWTVDEVANRARCAKGLVNYHHKSKQELLMRCADTIVSHRQARRMAALTGRSGAEAIDQLWAALAADVDEGWFGAWIAVNSDNRLRHAAATKSSEQASQLAALVVRAIGQPTESLDATLLVATLDGLELALLHGAGRGGVEEAYHRFWLGVL